MLRDLRLFTGSLRSRVSRGLAVMPEGEPSQTFASRRIGSIRSVSYQMKWRPGSAERVPDGHGVTALKALLLIPRIRDDQAGPLSLSQVRGRMVLRGEPVLLWLQDASDSHPASEVVSQCIAFIRRQEKHL